MPPFVPQPLPGIKRIVAVASGKGGVGKSTVAFHLARALSQKGQRVGLLDVDLHGPSLPFLMQSSEKPEAPDGQHILPIQRCGLSAMSMGFLIPEGKAAIWRGPMMHHALDQLLFRVVWGTLDFLVIDLPPGTGDIPLTLCQKVLMEVMIVSTSQELALQDARRGIQMFQKMGVPLVGLLENMAMVACPHCDHTIFPWGESRVASEAAAQDLPFLGQIPLHPVYQQAWQDGLPVTPPYLALAERL